MTRGMVYYPLLTLMLTLTLTRILTLTPIPILKPFVIADLRDGGSWDGWPLPIQNDCTSNTSKYHSQAAAVAQRKGLDFQPANLGSSPAVNHTSHWVMSGRASG